MLYYSTLYSYLYSSCHSGTLMWYILGFCRKYAPLLCVPTTIAVEVTVVLANTSWASLLLLFELQSYNT